MAGTITKAASSAAGKLGYNLQTGAFVFGIEIDLDTISLSNGDNYGFNQNWVYHNDNGVFLFDVTGRVGYAVGLALFYVKGGYAYIDSNFDLL